MDENKLVEEKSSSANGSKNVKDDKIESMINKWFICILVTLAVASVAAIACFIFLFVKVNERIIAAQALSSLGVQIQQNTLFLNSFNESGPSRLLAVPVSSCAALPPSSPSGNYWVRNSAGSAVLVYCDMTRLCGNVTGGWMRVAQMIMTDSSQLCPSGLRQRTDGNIRTCVRSAEAPGCSTVTLPTSGTNYSRVCGRIKAYQYGNTNAFEAEFDQIHLPYVDGVSLVYSGRNAGFQHIWTFAAALSQIVSNPRVVNYCPCMDNSTETEPPNFVGDDYFCDSGQTAFMGGEPPQFFPTPLWDGNGCGSENTCCDFNTPPWFYRQLPKPISADINLRVCRDESNRNEDIAIQEFEIYIQ